ncbi:MAG: S41 family peptidase [Candidatus Eisenbacteria bacterium]|nr:S41 family peptidase [Candidatus Eisenbacteria bacterium]
MLFKRNRGAVIGLIIGLIIGGWAFGKVQVSGENTYQELNLFVEVLSKVKAHYAEEVDTAKLIRGAIDGMLRELDPHSQYLDVKQYGELRDMTQGSYGGLGISIWVRDGYPTVISPMEGTPAYSMGIQSGDRIERIEGKNTYKMSMDDILSKLRGPKGTRVTFSVRREGDPELIDYTITRDIIKLKSVPYSFSMGSGIGYVRLSSFSEDTGEELTEALNKLAKDAGKGLLLDLRGNPGGLLTQAVEVSEKFVPAGKPVVETKGRATGQTRTYYSSSPEVYTAPLIILINEASASASEIVAGCVQDLDLGLVVGMTSFGKGSVQTVESLKDGKALKLTTAYYYTPSGRLINNREHNTALLGGDQGQEEAKSETEKEKPMFHTSAGRVVYGGGGITPDIVIEREAPKVSDSIRRRGYFFDFAVRYGGKHKDIGKDFEAGDAVLQEFRQFLKEKEFTVDEKEFEGEKARIALEIRAEIMRRFFGDEAAFREMMKADNQLQTAVGLFSRASNLAQLLKLAEERKGH